MARRSAELAPAGLVASLLLLATLFEGAFALRWWTPVALLVLVLLAVGTRVTRPRLEHLPAAALAVLAGWALLSAVWGDTPGPAVEGAARTMLYAGLAACGVLLVSTRHDARRLGDLITLGLAAIVTVTVVAVLTDAQDAFLAGRLDAPIGYRNGTAAIFAMAFWALGCVGASRLRPLWARVPACSLAALALGLVFLTQSRGAAVGLVAGAVVAIGLGPERVRRAWLAIAAVIGVALLSDPLLRPYNAFLDVGAVAAGDLDTAADALLVLAAGIAVLALLGGLFDRGLRATDGAIRVARRLALGTLVIFTLAGAVAGLAVVGDPIALAGDKLAEFRSLDTAAPGETQTRLGSVGGQRYDLWRIAWDQFASAPLLGAGEGGYPIAYYAQRATDRNLITPHSLPLRLAAELGLVGVLLLATFVVATAVVLIRGARGAEHVPRRDASALAAVGAVALSQTTVDWLWLVPGVVGLAFLALGLAVRTAAGDDEGIRVRRAPRIAFAAVAALGGVLVALLFLADVSVRQARAAEDPRPRLDRARTAETLNPFALAPLRLQAGALESLDRVDDARAALREAIELEPENFVNYALLADLELRAGRPAEAQRLYAMALRLNPQDIGLRQLVELAREAQAESSRASR
ncbi:MAG: O-antigen ligase family protein [Solirubrobacteraceae bacterium MAG38_C4-C5]|nr:O-antigen ligase family protein [Candidatus Siliceabacter maunaloa]